MICSPIVIGNTGTLKYKYDENFVCAKLFWLYAQPFCGFLKKKGQSGHHISVRLNLHNWATSDAALFLGLYKHGVRLAMCQQLGKYVFRFISRSSYYISN